MDRQQIQDLIAAKIAGQGNQVDIGGVLADIAPTMLKLLGLPQPSSMTGKSIIL